MNFDKHTYELINDFLDGKLPPEEKLAFQTQLDQDTELQEELETYKLTNLVVKAAASNELRQEIQSGIKEYDQSVKSRWLRNGLIVLFALSLVSASGIFWYSEKQDHTSDKEITSSNIPTSDKTDESVSPSLPEEQKTDPPAKISEPVVSPTNKEPVPVAKTRSVDTTRENTTNDQGASITDSTDSIGSEKVSKKDRTTDLLADQDTTLKKTAVTAPKAADCSQFSLVGEPRITAACAGKNDGVVDYSSLTASDDSNDLTVSSDLGRKAGKNTYDRLYSGYYTFTISNQAGCSIEEEVYVPEKNCFPKDFIINPSAGESWEAPVADSEVFSLSIVDTQGKTVFSKERAQNLSWEGIDQYGSPLPAGLYVYLIKLGDQRVKSGQITIIR